MRNSFSNLVLSGADGKKRQGILRGIVFGFTLSSPLRILQGSLGCILSLEKKMKEKFEERKAADFVE